MSEPNWVVCDAKKQEFRCNRCGVTHPMRLPAAVYIFVAEAKAFTERHSQCTVLRRQKAGK